MVGWNRYRCSTPTPTNNTCYCIVLRTFPSLKKPPQIVDMPIATPQGTLDFKSVDKVTFVGTSSNTVIDTTTGSLGVGVGVNGPTSNLHVVGHTRLEGDINMLHTSNNAAIKLNSNVVTEFSRSKKLIKYPRVAMTQNALNNGYAAEASTENDGTSTGQAYRAFDGIVAGERGYHSAITYSSGSTYTGSASITDAHGTQHQGEWIKLQMPTTEKMKLSGFSFSPRYISGSEYHHRAPYKGVFLGSTDGTNWYPIHYFDNVTVPELTTVSRTFENNTNDYYNHIALVAYEVGPNATGNVLNFAEMELFGLPEYDPDADGVDVKVTSYPNVPNTDWLEVYYDAKESSSYPGTGGTVLDLSGNQINGTLNGGVGFDSEYKAFTFDEADDYITLDTGKTGNYIFSVSLWFKSSGNSIETLFHMNGDYATNNTVWIKGDATSLSIGFVNNDYSCDTGKEIADNMWHHASFVYNGNGESGRDIYLDGIHLGGSLVGSSAGDNLNLTSTSSISRIGALNHSSLGIIHEFKGSIANFRLFNRALSQDEIYQLYAYQKEYFGHGDLSMTLKAGRLGIGTSEPRAALDVKGDIYGGCPVYFNVRCSTNAAAGIIPWDIITESKGGGFDTTTGTFITPLTGVYSFSYSIRERDNNANLYTYLVINGVEDPVFGRLYCRSNYAHSAITFLRFMNQGDTLAIDLNGGDMANSYNSFSGQYISSV